MYNIYSNRTFEQCEDIDRIRQEKCNFSLWIDIEKRDVTEKDKGKIDVISKRILGRLLCFLIMNTGKKYTYDKLYEAIWLLPVYNLSEENKVKVSISRLRNLIEPTGEWKYILKTNPILGFKGEYYFNPLASYCLIVPHNLQFFKL